ncbi:carboxy terminal-processing peptidase [Marinospirillum alkaliphilum]|uniref:Carboxyl-terminal processing protease n=1 Tax=Marinospirillum alkaliphilum DSM 21637 TaxID=1122209 RepID=A0A1K1TDP0_9GAMM|nr:carboxy terminal-processing peptidase [Marinospirillum alkaliphilum]SFW98761.1 carboxyl-terminal processing protease [Marinospirillum alkaliphilum DSM 21637]
MRKHLLRGLMIGWLLLGLVPLALATEPSTRQYTPLEELQPTSAHRQVAREVTRLMTRQHFADVTLNSSLEQQALDNYLKQLDPNKALLTAAEARQILARTGDLEAALVKGDLEFAFEVFIHVTGLHKERLEQNLRQLNNKLDSFRFDQDQRFSADRREVAWPETQAELDLYWQQRLTHELLSLMDADQSVEEARDLLVRRYQNQLNRLRQTNADDIFQGFMNAFTTSVDPHTNYFSPRRSESFNIQMKLSLDGIGAMLQSENEYTKVVSLVPGGPADRQGQLRPTDRIIGVGQGKDGEIENVIGWRLDEVVDQIRGPRGSIVRLEVLSSDSTNRRLIEIERNAVQLEDQAASKRVIETTLDGETRRIGVIEIPTFYLDFEGQRTNRRDYRSTTRDVARLIDELKKEGIDGLVIDLRNNGGGALQEANSLVGLFIPRGPTVQVRDADGNVNILGDNGGRVHYDGPLAVVINRLSASASEIFAGAIQDYGRGLVVGEQSFGKGTVQTIMDLSYGQLKITRAKFYRISGDSTQHRGIVPDILFPPLFDPNRIGESASPNALPWDQVQAVLPPRHSIVQRALTQLKDRHQQRIASDPNFRFLSEQSDWLRRHDGAPSISLNRQQRQLEQEKEKAEQLAMENRRRQGLGLEPLAKLEEETEEDHATQREPTPVDLAILEETGRILVDFSRMVSSAN